MLLSFVIYTTILIQIYSSKKLILLNEYFANDLFTIFENDNTTFIIGSRNRIIVISAETFRLKRIISLNVTTIEAAECLMKGFGKEKCQNDITLLSHHSNNCLRICGTNALAPYCQIRNKRNLFEECETGLNAIGLSTFSSDCPAYHLSYGNYTFTALAVDISCQKRTLLRALPKHKRLWLPVNDDRWFHGPTFIGLFGWKQFIYVVFNEQNHEGVKAQIGSVCANDPTIIDDDIIPYKNIFNSFAKLSLTCPLDSNNFNLQMIILKTAGIFANFIFAIFWNGFERLPISALCIFDLNKIEEKLFGNDEVLEADLEMKNDHCPRRNQSGLPRILDKTSITVKPYAYYIFPEMTEIVSINVIDNDSKNYHIIAISKKGKVYGLIFNDNFINEKWTDQITINGKLLEMKIRKKTFTVLSSNSFKEYKIKDWLSEITENINQSIRQQCYCEWTEWNSCSQRCAGGYRNREWRCSNGDSCNSLKENNQQYQSCNNISCNEVRRYSTWSQWLAVGGNTEIRYRASCGVEVPNPMSIKSILHGSKRVLMHEWLAWSEWTACSATCGNSLRNRWRMKKGLVLSYNDSIQYIVEPCSIPSCKCDDMDEWINGSDIRWKFLKYSSSFRISDFFYGFCIISLLLTHSSMFLLGINLRKIQQIYQTSINS
ncbi:Semaphorin-1A [Dirofilaria immitis]